MLLGGPFLVVRQIFSLKLKGSGLGAHLAGVVSALPQPVCSCFAAPVGATLYSKGASLGPMLAFTVSSPMLNITTLILAAALLPIEFAVLRTGGHHSGRLHNLWRLSHRSQMGERRRTESRREQTRRLELKGAWRLSRLFHFEKLFSETIIESPAALISNWLGMTWRLTRVVVPLLVIFSVIAVYIVQVMPDSENNITGVAVTAIFATLLMIPTWTEVPLAAGLINNGLTGIAAVMLITLPAVSIPGLLITAGAVRSLKVALILGLSVLIAGILAGIIFL